jgi:hypothetical protein
MEKSQKLAKKCIVHLSAVVSAGLHCLFQSLIGYLLESFWYLAGLLSAAAFDIVKRRLHLHLIDNYTVHIRFYFTPCYTLLIKDQINLERNLFI